MFGHVNRKEDAHGSPVQGVLLVLLLLAVTGLIAAYARTVALFARVFVRVFLEELRAQPKPRRRARPHAADDAG